MRWAIQAGSGSLRHRVTVLVLGLTSLLLCCAAVMWGYATKQAIHEEVEAASRVSRQWLTMFSRNASPLSSETLVQQIQALGRLRASQLEIHNSQGELAYRSPPSPYKAGRDAPAWFAAWFSPDLPTQEIKIGTWQIRLAPDASRAILDAWDTLVWSLGWAGLLLLVLGLGLRFALGKTLAPLSALEAEQYFAACLNQRLENERQQLARELHDEFGQGITAVQAIAGAIAQRSRQGDSDSRSIEQLHGSAQAILAMTAQMQQGVRGILQRLREPSGLPDVAQRLQQQCQYWQTLHPEITLTVQLDPCPDDLPAAYQHCVLRLVQESLTNIARHAAASQVEVRLQILAEGLQLRINDNGQGCASLGNKAGSFGLRGMRERVAEWQGELHFHSRHGLGCCVTAHLPWPSQITTPATTEQNSCPTYP